MSLKLNRLGSIWDRTQLLEQNENIDKTERFLSKFDGTRLLEQTANLFNKAQAGYGSVDQNTGKVNEDGFRNTGFIKVEPDTVYRMNPKMGVGAMYDENLNYVAAISTAGDTIRTTVNTRYVRISVSGSTLDTTMFYKGSTQKSYVEYGFKPSPLIMDDTSIKNELTINQGQIYPLKLHQLGSGELKIAELHKNAVLDAKVYGAIPGKIYRLTYVSNGYVNSKVGGETWGITVVEMNKDGSDERIVTNYNEHPGERGSAGIDTIIQYESDMVFSVTVDRKVISESNIPTHMNLSTSPNVIIAPSKYSF